MRISGGGDSGRLEFKLSNGTWGTVCSQGFDDDAGDVACKQLGYLRSSDILDSSQLVRHIYTSYSYYGAGLVQVHNLLAID